MTKEGFLNAVELLKNSNIVPFIINEEYQFVIDTDGYVYGETQKEGEKNG